MEFSEKWKDKSQEERYDYLSKLCDSQNSALDQMQKERDKWLEKCKFLEAMLGNAQEAFDNQKAINHDLMTTQNSDQQSINHDIKKMVAYIGELGGDINRLGN